MENNYKGVAYMIDYKAKEDKRQCLLCGRSLAGKQKTAKFCSDEHRLEWHKSKRNENKEEVVKNKTCKFCSGEFVVKGNSKRVYCSDQCSTKAQRLKIKEWRERKKNNPKKECLYCSKDITGKTESYCSKGCFDEARKKQNRERFRKENGLYDKYGKERKCKHCSKDISDRPIDSLYCDTNCRDMFRYFETTTNMPIDEYRKMIAEQKEQRLARLEIEAKERQKQRAISNIARLLNKEVLRRERVVELTRPCIECGTPFYNPHPHALTCTPLCSKRRSNRLQRLYNSNRLNEHNIVDKDITVQKLFDKYDGICYLCGKECDFNDKVITEEGYTIVGKTYPSIEHVIPISKHGLHSWDNVNLAHHYCNTLKSNKI